MSIDLVGVIVIKVGWVLGPSDSAFELELAALPEFKAAQKHTLMIL